jgi:hypothetical protein
MGRTPYLGDIEFKSAILIAIFRVFPQLQQAYTGKSSTASFLSKFVIHISFNHSVTRSASY